MTDQRSRAVGAPTPEESSRRTAVRVNVEKLLLLAALTPFVVAGISQRATALVGGDEAARVVALTVAAGAACAVLGALGFGWLGDRGEDPGRRRWRWVIVAVLVGTAGLFTAMIPSLPALVAGWAVAQFGYSGAMALLRTLLASTATAHRRRGSVVMVLGAYLGAFIPIVLLIALPGGIWAISAATAVLCVSYPLLVLARGAGEPGRLPEAGRAGEPEASRTSPVQRRDVATGGTDRRGRIPAPLLLLVQCASSAVVAAFLTYHPLDLERRLGLSGDGFVRASAVVLAAALAGLLITGVTLLLRPRVLGSARTLLICAALLLGASIGLRGIADALPLIVFAAFLSGVAVGANSSTLLVAALEAAPPDRAGRFIGAYSAAGALGQFIGPLLGLLLLGAVAGAPTDFPLLFLGLAALPGLWALLIALVRVPDGSERSRGRRAGQRSR